MMGGRTMKRIKNFALVVLGISAISCSKVQDFPENQKAPVIVSANDTRLVVVLPDNPEGQYPFVVSVDGETVSGPNFTYDKKPELTVFSITPNSGSEGDIVEVAGICFSEIPAENQVSFNGVPAEVLSATTTKLSVKIPYPRRNRGRIAGRHMFGSPVHAVQPH